MTNGFGAMPDYRVQIAPRDRWAIVAYIRALQLSQHAAAADVPGGDPTKVAAPAAAGKDASGTARRRNTDRMDTHADDHRRAGARAAAALGARSSAFWGLLAGAVGAFLNLDQFFRSWLIGFLFCLGLTMGSLALLMLQHLSGGQWGLVGRRVFEAASRNAAVRRAAVRADAVRPAAALRVGAARTRCGQTTILQMKAPYLNVPFFIARAVLYFAVWLLCAWLLNAWSAAQDRGEVAVDPADTRALPRGQRARAADLRASR